MPDTTQEPFVISVIPVVGDFAAAQQPVIVVLSQGTSLTVQAVVSNDRRFVRLTVVPFFSQIGDVNTFTFTGSSSTTQKSSDSKTRRPILSTSAGRRQLEHGNHRAVADSSRSSRSRPPSACPTAAPCCWAASNG